jgi:hypothetical protein
MNRICLIGMTALALTVAGCGGGSDEGGKEVDPACAGLGGSAQAACENMTPQERANAEAVKGLLDELRVNDQFMHDLCGLVAAGSYDLPETKFQESLDMMSRYAMQLYGEPEFEVARTAVGIAGTFC